MTNKLQLYDVKKSLGMLEVPSKSLEITCLTTCDLKDFFPTFSVGLPCKKPKEMWSIAQLRKKKRNKTEKRKKRKIQEYPHTVQNLQQL